MRLLRFVYFLNIILYFPTKLYYSIQVLSLQSPLQKAAREKYEATGEIWVGEAPDVINKKIFNDFISAQTKVSMFPSDISTLI